MVGCMCTVRRNERYARAWQTCAAGKFYVEPYKRLEVRGYKSRVAPRQSVLLVLMSGAGRWIARFQVAGPPKTDGSRAWLLSIVNWPSLTSLLAMAMECRDLEYK